MAYAMFLTLISYLLPSIALLKDAFAPCSYATRIILPPLSTIFRQVLRVPVDPLGLRVNIISYVKPFLVPRT